MDKDEAMEAARAVECGEMPSGSVVIAVTGENSLMTPGARLPDHMVEHHGYAREYVERTSVGGLAEEHARLHEDETAEHLDHTHGESA